MLMRMMGKQQIGFVRLHASYCKGQAIPWVDYKDVQKKEIKRIFFQTWEEGMATSTFISKRSSVLDEWPV